MKRRKKVVADGREQTSLLGLPALSGRAALSLAAAELAEIQQSSHWFK